MYLVTAYFDFKSSQEFCDVIENIAAHTGNDFMTANKIPPHLTLLQFHSKTDTKKIISAFENAIAPDYKIDVSFKGYKTEIPHVVYVPAENDRLMKLNKMLSDSFSLLGETVISSHYSPENFYPHVTLAKRLDDVQRKKTIEFMKDKIIPSSGKITKIVLTEGRPPKILREIILSLCQSRQ